MKVLYRNDNGSILQTIFDKDYFSTSITINVPYTILEIDEVIPNNKASCLELSRYGTSGKYKVSDGMIVLNLDWVPVEDI